MKRIFRARDFQPNADQDLDDEFDSHLELRIEDLMASGISLEAEARA